jgi:dTDP-4-amino-4,6-dideoxygalactose transaminase
MDIRHQLPAYSPITARASLLAVAQALHFGEDPRSRLRALLEREYESRSVLLCGSGTQALTIAIREAGRRVDHDSPVALPAFCCFDVASAAVGADARIMLYDLDPDTLGPDVESLQRVLRAGAGVVVIAPLYGLPVNWSELSALAERYNAVLIEDAAQGNGASWSGRRLGTLGKITMLSFGRGKGWTGGSGGALLVHDAAGPERGDFPEPEFSRRAAVTIGLIAQWGFARPAVYGIPLSIPALRLGQTTYLAPRPVRSMARAAAALLLATYEASRKEAEARQANAAQWLATIARNANARAIRVHNLGTAGYLRLPVRLSKGMAAFESQPRALHLGIAPSYPISLAELPQLAEKLEGPERVWPGAQTLVHELVTLPTHSRLGRHEIADLDRILRNLGR